MTGMHPEEIDLFDYVEGDLPAPRRAELEVHLAACAQCAEQVARVQAGRDALRASQFMQLPARRREGALLNLPAQRREPVRSPAFSPKRMLAILTPIVAVVAVIVALANTGGLGGGQGQGAGTVTTAGGAAAAGTTSREASTAPKASGFDSAQALSVLGPADQVAAELRSKGFDARAVGDRVDVRNATKRQVERALQGRRSGKVRIVIIR